MTIYFFFLFSRRGNKDEDFGQCLWFSTCFCESGSRPVSRPRPDTTCFTSANSSRTTSVAAAAAGGGAGGGEAAVVDLAAGAVGN